MLKWAANALSDEVSWAAVYDHSSSPLALYFACTSIGPSDWIHS